jgi:hypothetical protein
MGRKPGGASNVQQIDGGQVMIIAQGLVSANRERRGRRRCLDDAARTGRRRLCGGYASFMFYGIVQKAEFVNGAMVWNRIDIDALFQQLRT